MTASPVQAQSATKSSASSKSAKTAKGSSKASSKGSSKAATSKTPSKTESKTASKTTSHASTKTSKPPAKSTSVAKSRSAETSTASSRKIAVPVASRAAADGPVVPPSGGPMPYVVTHATTVSIAPDAGTRGQLQPGTPVEVLGRDRGWVRVRSEGWVREADLTPSDTAIRTAVSAADLRSAPERFRGVMLKWTVEYLAFQTADTLRHGLTPGEPYLLARGPGMEDALVYLAVPQSLLATARALTPMSKITVVARVRTGRSEPAGVAVLDLESIQPLK